MTRRLGWFRFPVVLAATALFAELAGAAPASAQPSSTITSTDTATQAGLTLEGAFTNSAGTAVAGTDGLTFTYDSVQFTDQDLVYPSSLWGQYPLYLPGTDVHADATVSNTHIAVGDIFVLNSRVYQVTPQGTAGTEIAFTQGQPVTVPAGGTVVVPVDVGLPPGLGGGLYVLHVFLGVYAKGRPSSHSRVPPFLEIHMVFGSPGA